MKYEEKVKRSILQDVDRGLIPARSDRPTPIYEFCQKCKRGKVKNHHFLCDSCWRDKQLKKLERKWKNMS